MEARTQLPPRPRSASFADRPVDRAGRNLRRLYLHPHLCLVRMAGTHRNALMIFGLCRRPMGVLIYSWRVASDGPTGWLQESSAGYRRVYLLAPSRPKGGS